MDEAVEEKEMAVDDCLHSFICIFSVGGWYRIVSSSKSMAVEG